MKKYLWFAGKVCVLCAFFVAAVVPFSCRMTEEGLKFVVGDLASPKIVSFRVVGENSVCLEFSERVKIKSAGVRKIGKLANTIEENEENDEAFAAEAAESGQYVFFEAANFSEDGKKVELNFAQKFAVGERHELYGKISDNAGNTLTFSLPFWGYNSRVPAVKIIAVHPKYSSSNRAGETVYKNEFVGLFVATDGNLAGLQIVSAQDGEDKSFLLPAVEVRAGTFVTAHMRSRGGGCVSELPENLRSCRQEYASDGALDLWSENTAACLGDAADVITVRNAADGSVLDCLAYSPDGSAEMLKSIKNLAAWGGLPQHIVAADNLTASKMLARTDAANIKKASGEAEGSWTVTAVFSGSGKNRQINLGRFVR